MIGRQTKAVPQVVYKYAYNNEVAQTIKLRGVPGYQFVDAGWVYRYGRSFLRFEFALTPKTDEN